MKFYGRRAGSKLAEALAAMAELGSDILSLEEEVTCARVLADEALKTFEQACLSPTTAPSTRAELQALAIATSREALTHVAKLVETHAKVRALSGAMVAPEDVRRLADLMVVAVRGALEERGITDPAIIEHVEKTLGDVPLPAQPGVSRPAITLAVS